ncbi:MAG: hypothetical protein U0X73_02180 [Thermoanaerobaculia bacterium]
MPEIRRIVRSLAGLALAAALVAAVGALAHMPLGAPATAAALRLALRAEHAKIEICRDLTESELAQLPAHMRQRRQCQETAIDYRLRVTIDGTSRLEREVRHKGVRRTRPLAVEEQLEIPPGRHDVEVEFRPVPPAGAPAEATAELGSPRFTGVVEFPRGRVRILVLGPGGVFDLRPLPPASGPAAHQAAGEEDDQQSED